MNPTPQPLSRSIAEEIDLELSNQFPHAHDWSEAQLQAAAEVIEKHLSPLAKCVEVLEAWNKYTREMEMAVPDLNLRIHLRRVATQSTEEALSFLKAKGKL